MQKNITTTLNFDILPHTLHFKQPAGTSRGIYRLRKVWYVVAHDTERPGLIGIGECAPLVDLSCDYDATYDDRLSEMCQMTSQLGHIDYATLKSYPSILFGIETALQHLNAGSFKLWDNEFTQGKETITINGLVWMGSFDEMKQRIDEKLEKGFRCVKLKIGAIDFDNEIELIKKIRERYSSDTIELRVDANGAFSSQDAPSKLEVLSKYDIHSIEQPIRAGRWDDMAMLCRNTPVPIALDEELIGVNNAIDKVHLLDIIGPQYIIVKPSLHGGLAGSKEWIDLAAERDIASWVTSALESNIGLNALAQWVAEMKTTFEDNGFGGMPQGLGTGMLYNDNFQMPLNLNGDQLSVSIDDMPDTEDFVSWITMTR